MNDLDDTALEYALDGREPDPGNRELMAAVDRAGRDVDRIRRALLLAAADETSPRTMRRRSRSRVVALSGALAVAAALAIVAIRVLPGDDTSRVASPPAAATAPASPPSTASTVGSAAPVLPLPDMARAAERIVIGRIERLDRGLNSPPGQPGMPYVLATISVEESLKPAGDAIKQVVAFDYDYGGAITSAGPAPAWNEGDRVVLFLVSDAGTVSENLKPAHLQVLEGSRGRYSIVNGEIQGPFTLEQVREAAAAAG
jgi:hypothetical protein